MKTIYFIYLCLLLFGFQACTPDEAERFDLSAYEVAKIKLGADHRQLIADGISTLTLNPMLYKAYTYVNDEGRDSVNYGKIPVDRIVPGSVKYFLEDGTPLDDDTYKTTDLSKGEQGFYAMVGDVMSDTFRITLRSPFPDNAYEVIEYPVVFHIIQNKKNVDFGLGIGSDIVYYAFDIIHNCFARTTTFSPNGADTKIRFRLAEYDPQGKKMTEKGINRYPLPEKELDELTMDGIKNNPQVCWDYKKYLNIWVVEDFGNSATTPKYIAASADLDQIKGIGVSKLPVDEIMLQDYTLMDIGLIYDATDFATEDVGYATQMGKFFGLLETKDKKEDYCDDTFTYTTYREPWDSGSQASNSRLKISSDGLIFYSVNIMDDGSYKNTISMEQVKRIRTIADNCPHRWAWKSKWAFTGKE